jgi:hypothetical protein
LNLPTPGAANSAAATAAASNLVINEWLANAVPGGSDWLEIYNRSATQPAALKGIYLARATRCSIKSLSFLAPNGFIQLFADELPGRASDFARRRQRGYRASDNLCSNRPRDLWQPGAGVTKADCLTVPRPSPFPGQRQSRREQLPGFLCRAVPE